MRHPPHSLGPRMTIMTRAPHKARRARGRRCRAIPPQTLDDLARYVVHSAPEPFFDLLRWVAAPPRPYTALTRLDAQAAPDRRRPDLVYLGQQSESADAWVVELHARADQWRADRASMAAGLAWNQCRRLHPDGSLLVRLVQTRTLQRARHEGLESDDRLQQAVNDHPCGVVRWYTTNRLVRDGPWTAVLRDNPLAWPLLALCPYISADEVAARSELLGALRQRAGDDPELDRTHSLLRYVGRARFPKDQRFIEEEAMTMINAMSAPQPWGQLHPEEVENHVARAKAEHRRQMEEMRARGERRGKKRGLHIGKRIGRVEGKQIGLSEGKQIGLSEGKQIGLSEGRRTSLLHLAARIDARRAQELEAIKDLDALEDAVVALLEQGR